MAFTLPLLLLISIGIIEFGRAFQTWQILTNAAREGARVAVLPGMTDSMVTARVQQYIQAGRARRRRDPDDRHSTQRRISYGSGNGDRLEGHGELSLSLHSPEQHREARRQRHDRGSDFTMATSATMRNEN
jgi:hypothetical protein